MVSSSYVNLFDYYRTALQQAILYNTLPNLAYLLLLPDFPDLTPVTTQLTTRSNMRFEPLTDGEPRINALDAGTDVTVLAKTTTEDGNWIYVGHPIDESYQYDWIY